MKGKGTQFIVLKLDMNEIHEALTMGIYPINSKYWGR